MTVTVFTKPHCPQCDATKRQLTKLGVPFETVDLTQNPSTLEQLQAAGFQQAPVVITPDNSWTGYRPDILRIRPASCSISASVNPIPLNPMQWRER